MNVKFPFLFNSVIGSISLLRLPYCDPVGQSCVKIVNDAYDLLFGEKRLVMVNS